MSQQNDAKTCPLCEETKAITEFGRNRRRPGGRQSYCKACQREYGRAYQMGVSFKEWRAQRVDLAQPDQTKQSRALNRALENRPRRYCVRCGTHKPVGVTYWRRTARGYDSVCRQCRHEEDSSYVLWREGVRGA